MEPSASCGSCIQQPASVVSYTVMVSFVTRVPLPLFMEPSASYGSCMQQAASVVSYTVMVSFCDQSTSATVHGTICLLWLLHTTTCFSGVVHCDGVFCDQSTSATVHGTICLLRLLHATSCSSGVVHCDGVFCNQKVPAPTHGTHLPVTQLQLLQHGLTLCGIRAVIE